MGWLGRLLPRGVSSSNLNPFRPVGNRLNLSTPTEPIIQPENRKRRRGVVPAFDGPLPSVVIPPYRGTAPVQAVPVSQPVTDPGNYFTGRLQSLGDSANTGIPINTPDAALWFRASRQQYNCIEIDCEFVPVDQGWMVPEYMTLTLLENKPQNPNNFFQNVSVPSINADPGLGQTNGFAQSPFPPVPWNWVRDVDFVYQAAILRGSTAIGPYIGDISLTLPDRKIFSIQGAKRFRFALLGWWYKHRDPHDSIEGSLSPTFTVRAWYDPTKDRLISIH